VGAYNKGGAAERGKEITKAKRNKGGIGMSTLGLLRGRGEQGGWNGVGNLKKLLKTYGLEGSERDQPREGKFNHRAPKKEKGEVRVGKKSERGDWGAKITFRRNVLRGKAGTRGGLYSR